MSVAGRQLTLYASQARTATPTAAEFNCQGAHGLRVVIDVTAGSTLSVTPTVDFYDDLSTKWTTLITGAAITGTGTTVLTIYPSVTPVANVAVSAVAYGHMRLVLTHGNSNSATYTAAVHLLG